MEENSIIRAMAANGHTTTADVVNLLRDRITELEVINAQLLAAIVQRDNQIDRLTTKLKLETWRKGYRELRGQR